MYLRWLLSGCHGRVESPREKLYESLQYLLSGSFFWERLADHWPMLRIFCISQCYGFCHSAAVPLGSPISRMNWGVDSAETVLITELLSACGLSSSKRLDDVSLHAGNISPRAQVFIKPLSALSSLKFPQTKQATWASPRLNVQGHYLWYEYWEGCSPGSPQGNRVPHWHSIIVVEWICAAGLVGEESLFSYSLHKDLMGPNRWPRLIWVIAFAW